MKVNLTSGRWSNSLFFTAEVSVIVLSVSGRAPDGGKPVTTFLFSNRILGQWGSCR